MDGKKLYIAMGVVFAVTLLVYVRNLCPTIAPGDSGELITAAYTLGVAHPPGYPLFTMLGKIFTLVPLHSVAWRVNLMSAVCQAAAVALVFAAIMRLWGNLLAGIAGAGSLAFSRVFWHYAEVAEVFPLNNLFAAALLYLLVVWNASLPPLGEKKKRKKDPEGEKRQRLFLFVGAFLFGLSLSNHHTMILMAPALLFFLWSARTALSLTGKTAVITLCLFACGLLPYLYLPAAAAAKPVINWDNPTTPENFMNLVTRKDYGSLSLLPQNLKGEAAPVQPRIHQISHYGRGLFIHFGGLGMLLGCAGFFSLYRERRLFYTLTAAFFFTGIFFMLLANMPLSLPVYQGVLDRFFMLSEIVFSLSIGGGIMTLSSLLEKKAPPGAAKLILPLFTFLCVALPYSLNAKSCNHAGNDTALQYGRDILRELKPGTVLFSRGDNASLAVDYLQLVEKERPDVLTIEQEKLTYPWYMKQVKERYRALGLPGERYDGSDVRNVDLIRAVIGTHPVCFVTFKEESYQERFQAVPRGLVYEMAPLEQRVSLADQEKELHRIDRASGQRYRGPEFPPTSQEYFLLSQYGNAWFEVAYGYEKENNLGKAVECYRKAIERAPHHAQSYKNLAVIHYYKMNDTEKAKEYLRAYLRLNPCDPERQGIEQILRQ